MPTTPNNNNLLTPHAKNKELLSAKRISRKQYNKELNEAVARMDKGISISHKDALKQLANW